MKTISLCYIVKDEEKNIKNSILSCKNIVDEIVVVDTGSTDKTVEISQALGARIEHFEWCNDFAKARNYAITKCKGDYILFLDADEYFMPTLQKEDKEKIVCQIKDNIDTYAFLQEDIDAKTHKIHHRVFLTRLFKNCDYLRYSRPIHEAIKRVDNEEMETGIFTDFKIIHTGYSADISEKKAERNLKLLKSLMNKQPMDYFYLARESLSLGRPEDSIEYIEEFFAQPNAHNIIANSTMAYEIYFCGLQARKMLPNKYNNADILEWLKEIKSNLPFIPKTYFYLGLYYFDFDFHKSQEYFLEALLKEKEAIDSKTIKLDDFENYKAEIYYYLAKIEFFEGKRQNAINKAGVACVFDKTNPKYFGLLLSLLNQQRNQKIIAKNIEFISKLYQPHNKEDFIFIIKGLANSNLLEEFIHFSIFTVNNFTITAEDNCNDIYFAELVSTNNPDEVLEKVHNCSNKTADLIKVCCLIYKQAMQGSLDVWGEELKKLPQEYQEVFNLLIGLSLPKKITDEFRVLLKNVFIKLLYLGFADISVEFFELLLKIYGYDNNMSTILNLWISTGEAERYNKAIAFLYSINSEYIIDKDAYCKDYLYILYIAQDYDGVIETAWQFAKQDYALPMNFIKASRPTKRTLKKQRQLCNAEMI